MSSDTVFSGDKVLTPYRVHEWYPGSEMKRIFPAYTQAGAVGFSGAADLLAAADTETNRVRLLDLESRAQLGAPVATPRGTFQVHGLAFSPTASLLAAGSGDNRHVSLWRIVGSGPERRLVVNEPAVLEAGGNVTTTEFSPDGRLLAVGNSEGQVRLWRVGGWKLLPLTLLASGGGITRVAFADPHTLAAAEDRPGRTSLGHLQRPPARRDAGRAGPRARKRGLRR